MKWIVVRQVDAESQEDAATILDGIVSIRPKRHVSVEIKPIPPDQWPIWAIALSMLATKQDQGVGDTVARLIGDENSQKFKAWYKTTFGKDCNCTGRQKRWNKLYPHDQHSPREQSDPEH